MDVSKITNLQGTFQQARSFNRNVSSWDTSNVVTMERTFDNAAEFAGWGLENWNVNKVTSMRSMFRKVNAQEFNTDLSSWNTSSVTDFVNCFREDRSFNADISNWNTASVTSLGMFYQALNFNRDLSKWDTSKVINTVDTFNGASAFNGNISTWSTSSVTLMNNMFKDAQAFNGNVGQWDTSKVGGLWETFVHAAAFQGNGLESWNTSSVETAHSAFVGATSLNAILVLGTYVLCSSFFYIRKSLTLILLQITGKQFMAENMFSDNGALSDCNKRRIWDSWSTQFEVSVTNTSF